MPSRDGRREHSPSRSGDKSGDEPTPFDQKLAQADQTIKWFAVVSGLAAVASASAAVYAASQIKGSSDQTEMAINQMAAFANAETQQANASVSQLGAMNAEISEMRQQSGLIGNQAAAADRQAEIAQQQFVELKTEQRPIVFFGDIAARQTYVSKEAPCCLSNLPDVQNRERVIALHVLIGNSGNSQTQRLKIIARCLRLGLGEHVSDPFARFRWDETNATEQVIAPKQTIEVQGCTFTQEDALNAQSGIVRTYLVGEARYGDRVTKGQPYVTQFAKEVHVTEGANDLAQFRGSLVSVGGHNCTDADCKR